MKIDYNITSHYQIPDDKDKECFEVIFETLNNFLPQIWDNIIGNIINITDEEHVSEILASLLSTFLVNFSSEWIKKIVDHLDESDDKKMTLKTELTKNIFDSVSKVVNYVDISKMN